MLDHPQYTRGLRYPRHPRRLTNITGLLLLLAALTLPLPAAAESPAPALKHWLQQALAEHPQLRLQQAAVEAARAQEDAADQALFNPELALELENAAETTTTAGISQTFDWSNKRAARSDIASTGTALANAQLHLQQQRLATRLLTALASYRTASAVADASAQQRRLMDEFVSLAEQRYAAGDLSQVDLDLAHLAAAEAAFRHAAAREDLTVAEQTLHAEGIDQLGALPPLPATPDTESRPQAIRLDRLPEQQIAWLRQRAAEQTVELRQRQRRADPNVGLVLGKDGSDTLTGIQFSIPLNIRNPYKAEVTAARAEAMAAKQATTLSHRELQSRLNIAHQLYRNALETWQQWRENGANRLHQRTDLLARLWRAGELRTTDYLVQLQQTLDTRISAIEQQGRLWNAWAQWLGISGQIDAWFPHSLPGSQAQAPAQPAAKPEGEHS